MNDAVRVSFSQRVRDLGCDRQRLCQFEWLSFHAYVERLAFDVRHDDEAAAICFRDFVHRADVWMIEFCGGLSFAEQTLASVFVLGGISREQFNGDATVQHCIFREINFAHAALANLRANFVTTESGARSEEHTSELQS